MPLETNYAFHIYKNTNTLPKKWNEIAVNNIFLSKEYLQVLDESSPKNMICHYIGLFKNEKIVGVALTQTLNLTHVSSFGANKSCIKSKLRDFTFRKFAANVLFVGNNMLTGQNAYCFSNEISTPQGLAILEKAIFQLKIDLKKSGTKIHITAFKDFSISESDHFKIENFKNYYQFSTQPNMVFTNNNSWENESDYTAALTKKYRDHYKRARKKGEMVSKRQMSLEEIQDNETKINELYFNVTKNAPFNTFYLAENHFANLKEILNEKFLFYGYFIKEKLIGFNTMIINGDALDTYFLGYDDRHQKENMLYLNMLYDMIGYSIAKKYSKIIFSRTALEIKSSVGAKPIQVVGFIYHSNSIINKYLGKLFQYFDSDVIWVERNPFK